MKNETRPVIGLPRGLLYHRYETLWQTFFHALGMETKVSAPTNRAVVEEGERLAPDEACLSEKIFLGHVSSLIGKCDYIFVPRVANLGRNLDLCVRFSALYDLTRCIFRQTDQKFLTCNIDVVNGAAEEDAFCALGQSLDFTHKESKKAWKEAQKAQEQAWDRAVKEQERLYKSEGLKILVVGHSYILDDSYAGGVILKGLTDLDTLPLRADITDRDYAVKHSPELCPTCRWVMSRELVGSIIQHRFQVDGIVLVTAFPCGPDSIVDDILARKIQGIPVLQLVLDSQTGTAGVEIRLESFVDIIRMKKGGLA
ncbi:MAG: acyl-CoA dehydratase activase-related protein [Lachnospiraceae bacterium]|nr:acyl-CoA dehydratase activase-related protein [Lachnospiraceae bacterium]